MKKRVKDKKKVVGAIGIVTAAVCCLGVASATNVTGNGVFDAKLVEVYAEEATETTSTNLKQWRENIEKLKTGNVDSQSSYVSYLYAFINARNAYSKINGTSDIAQITDDERTIYDTARGIVENDANCYEYFSSTLYNLSVSDTGITEGVVKPSYDGAKWSDKTDYDTQKDILDNLEQMRKDAITTSLFQGDEFQNLTNYATARFGYIQTAMDAVKDAINDIHYADGKIVVDSKESLDAVAEKIEAIYGVSYENIDAKEVDAIRSYLTEGETDLLGKYEEAIKDYNAIVTACQELSNAISAKYKLLAKEEIVETETIVAYTNVYTNKVDIEGLRTKFNDLKGQYGDVTNLVESYGLLENLEAELARIEQAKANVESLLAKIPAEQNYNEEYVQAYEEAQQAFDALPNDLKNIATSEISDYDKLLSAWSFIGVCVSEVEALQGDALNLVGLLEANSAEFSTAVNAVVEARANLKYELQKDQFNKTVVKGQVEKTYADLLNEMRGKVATLNKTVQPVIKAIDEIGEVKLSDSGIATRINTARGLYDALETELEKNSVTNFSVLVKAEETLDELTQEANAWKVAVNTIFDAISANKITFTNVEDIKGVEDTFKSWKEDAEKADLASVVESSGDFYGYNNYLELIKARDELIENVEELAVDMNNLSTDLEVISADPTAFTDAVEKAQTAFESLDESVQVAYFSDENAENFTAYGNYEEALNLYNNVYKLVGNIIKLGNEQVTMQQYDSVYAYITEFDELSEENKAIVVDGGYKATLDGAQATVDALKQARDTWTEEVYALVGGIEKANWETELYSVDLTKVETLKQERVNLDNTDNGLDEVDVDLATIEQIGNKRVDDLNDKIDELENKAELEKSDVVTLESIYDIYNNKLDQTQKDNVNYSAFEVLYNKYVFAQNFDEAVLALYEDVIINGNYTSQVPVTVGLLRSIYINFGSEMKALIQEYSKIDEIENEYNAHVEQEGGILNLTGVYNDLMTKIDANGDNLSDVIDNLTALTDRITQLKNDLDALEKIVGAVDGDKTLSEQIADLKQGLADAKAEFEQADSDISDKLTKLETNLTDLVGQTKTELEGKITELKGDLEGAISTLENTLKEADETNKSELEGKITQLKGDLATTISTLESTLKQADEDIISDIAKVREELADAETRLNDALDVVKSELENLIAENKAELKAEIESLRETLTLITIILSIVSGLSLLGVIVLFVRKRR